MTTLEKLKDLITQGFYADRAGIQPESIFQSELMMEPDEVGELALLCEGEFGIHIVGTKHLDVVVTVGDMVELIDHLKEGR